MRNYRDFPKDGVGLGYPDGLYLNRMPAPDIQVLNLGPMPWTPAEILDDFPGYVIKSIEVLKPNPADDPTLLRINYGRLLLSIDLEPVKATD